jgi:SAM-dependent methyltransferase
LHVAQALRQRVLQRVAVAGRAKLPAVPDLVDEIGAFCAGMFKASGRPFVGPELVDAKRLLSEQLTRAFGESPRSKIEVAFEAPPATPLQYRVEPDLRSIADAYERWIGTHEGPLFGAHPDARVLSMVADCDDRSAWPVLDFGAGTGRNALALGRRGHPVDAVEITPQFAEMLEQQARNEGLNVRVVADDVFQSNQQLRRDYRLIFASEVVPDFRSVDQLRQLFQLAADVLLPSGKLLFNVHLCARGYNPERAARELAQQCYSSLFTSNEIAQAVAGLPFALRGNDSVLEYERSHLPAEQWPPTPWYENWISGLDVYDVAPGQCPVELRWLTFERVDAALAATALSAELGAVGRPRRYDPVALHQALVRRLFRRVSAATTLTLPAIPALAPLYTDMAVEMARALGRSMAKAQIDELQQHFDTTLQSAFTRSQRSNIVVEYEVQTGTELKYKITADPVALTAAYEQWHDTVPEPMFGADPDARLLSILQETPKARQGAALDIGAGLGRNALHLARVGLPVDALEITPRFAEHIRAEAERAHLPVRVLQHDVFAPDLPLRPSYWLILASGTAGDFRDGSQLRRLFELSDAVLGSDGLLLLGIHVAIAGYVPDAAARQWAQQCCAMFFTRSELDEALRDLPLTLVSDEPALAYERERRPAEAWPPSGAYLEWATTQHLFATEPELCPVELRWLLFRKLGMT